MMYLYLIIKEFLKSKNNVKEIISKKAMSSNNDVFKEVEAESRYKGTCYDILFIEMIWHSENLYTRE